MTVFFDTNIFVYAVSKSAEDAPQKAISTQLIATVDFSLSLQVIQEFINVCLGKVRLGQTSETITDTARFLFQFPCTVPSQQLVLDAIVIQRRFQIKYWDATIIAAAQELGCHTLYSEDLSHGQDYDGVKVINPFLELRV